MRTEVKAAKSNISRRFTPRFMMALNCFRKSFPIFGLRRLRVVCATPLLDVLEAAEEAPSCNTQYKV